MKRIVRNPAPAAGQRGVVLIAALAVLLMLTLLAVSMFRGFGLEERIAGNSREKAHAFYAAQTALQYAEQQLLSPTLGSPIPCQTGTALTAGSVTVCDTGTLTQQAAASATNVSGQWSAVAGATAYVLPSSYTGASAGQATYLYAQPMYQVSYLGQDPNMTGAYLYTVTALGFGANANSTAVVQSVYSVRPAIVQNTGGGNY